jgi:hypothetical protein
MTKKSERQRLRHDWEAIVAAYRITPATTSLAGFSKRMRVPLRTLQSRMKKDADEGSPWQRDLGDEVKKKTKQMQQRVAAGIAADQPITDEAVAVAAAAATNMEVLESHNALFTMQKELALSGMQLLKSQMDNGHIVIEKRAKGERSIELVDVDSTYVGKALTNYATTIDKVVKLERHHLGLDDESGDSYEEEMDELLAALEDDEQE